MNKCCCGCQYGYRHKSNIHFLLYDALSKVYGDNVVAPFSIANRYGYQFDIAIPKYMLAIECDGDWWHRGDRKRCDNIRDSYFRKRGWTTVRFGYSQILNETKTCVRLVKEIVKVIKNDKRRRHL